MSAILHFDDHGLSAARAERKGLIMVDFYATWCGPCRSLAPNLDALAEETGDRLAVIKVDIDPAPAAALAFGVRSVPTLVLLDEGRIRDVRSGLQSLSQLRAWVAILASPASSARA